MEELSPVFRRALSRVSALVTGSRFSKPVARVVLAAAGLSLLAFIGQTAVAGALATSPIARAPAGAIAGDAPVASAAALPPSTFAQDGLSVVASPAPLGSPASRGSRAPASPEDPVVLNTATEEDLRRLPGIGAKRAAAILAVRARLGRFHAIEDLLKVKGVGRATLKRLRPLVRLDPAASVEGGGSAPTSPSR